MLGEGWLSVMKNLRSQAPQGEGGMNHGVSECLRQESLAQICMCENPEPETPNLSPEKSGDCLTQGRIPSTLLWLP